MWARRGGVKVMRSRSGGLWIRWSGDSGVPGDGMSVNLTLETILLIREGYSVEV